MKRKLLATLVLGGLLFQWQGLSCIGVPTAGNLQYQLTQLATGETNAFLTLYNQILAALGQTTVG
ncbi:MAG: hypothetical protein JXO22_18245 [Phycisphaerae bacterium]|nr:hypothetical protein [Phycisphaerae bacterium]